ncbi:hypothetical protein GCM10025879_16410 [Leuconostoc litchii]|uniref:hypothetical protein n=1 Tax=Leuconostoc litchii TaxID=1981069 RepID=UPI0023E97B77|nr:hypothetical protein [Leuconostoc litchii]GMA70395.1 hypothetical protein GCM10025879_16410 [Leuconostoc litchii]
MLPTLRVTSLDKLKVFVPEKLIFEPMPYITCIGLYPFTSLLVKVTLLIFAVNWVAANEDISEYPLPSFHKNPCLTVIFDNVKFVCVVAAA